MVKGWVEKEMEVAVVLGLMKEGFDLSKLCEQIEIVVKSVIFDKNPKKRLSFSKCLTIIGS